MMLNKNSGAWIYHPFLLGQHMPRLRHLSFGVTMVYMRYLLVFIYILSMTGTAKEIDLKQIEFTTVDELKNYHNNPPPPKPPAERPRKKNRYFEPQKFMAILEKHALLTDLVTKKNFRTVKKIYVVAREVHLGSEKALLWGKSGNAIFSTNMVNLVSIQSDIDLLPTPKSYKTYPAHRNLTSDDKKLRLENSIKFHQEVTSLGIIANVLGIDQDLASGQRFALNSVYRSRLPFNFGLTVNYQQASWGSNSLWNALNVGPIIQASLLKRSRSTLKGIIGYEQTLFFNLKSNQKSIGLSGGALLTELNYSFGTRFGTFLLGFSMRFLKAKISNSGYNLPTNKRKGINSYALTLGYTFDLQL